MFTSTQIRVRYTDTVCGNLLAFTCCTLQVSYKYGCSLTISISFSSSSTVVTFLRAIFGISPSMHEWILRQQKYIQLVTPRETPWVDKKQAVENTHDFVTVIALNSRVVCSLIAREIADITPLQKSLYTEILTFISYFWFVENILYLCK